MNINKELLLKAKKAIKSVQSAEQLYNLSIFTNQYIDKPTRDNKEVLEIYCDLIESIVELDNLEENTKKYVK